MKKGTTLVEVIITISIIVVIAMGVSTFYYHNLIFEDESYSVADTTRTAHFLLEKIGGQIKQANSVNIGNGGTSLSLELEDVCHVYSLQNEILYLDVGTTGGACPASTTNTPLHSEEIKLTNNSDPSIQMFSGIPSDSDSEAVKIRLRIERVRKFASDENYFEETISKRT